MLLPYIPRIDLQIAEQAKLLQDNLTKPPGSLGRLEELSIQLCAITGQIKPKLDRKSVIVMAADHGVTVEKVSAYPAEVTGQMVKNFIQGGAAINVLARQAKTRVIVVDVGVSTQFDYKVHRSKQTQFVEKKVANGTLNMAIGPAMSIEQAESAIKVGMDIVEQEYKKGLDLVATGDMGIGNTTASAAIVSVVTGASPAEITGRGTGVDDPGLRHKIAIIEQAVTINIPNRNDPIDILCKVGGLEIAGLVGVILSAASKRIPVVIDGLVSGAAALIAVEMVPDVKQYLIAGHQSVEAGHKVLLRFLNIKPLLDLDLRLGEGTGAVLAFSLIEASIKILNEMSTFKDASVSGAIS